MSENSAGIRYHLINQLVKLLISEVNKTIQIVI